MTRTPKKPGKAQIAEWHGPFTHETWCLVNEAIGIDWRGLIQRMNQETVGCALAIPHCTTDDERWSLIAEGAYYGTISNWARYLGQPGVTS